MSTSRKASLDHYDKCTDAHMVAEYYRIIPEEKYEGDYYDDYVEIESEVPDFYPCTTTQDFKNAIPYRATIDHLFEISELISDIKNSKSNKFEILVQENCYEKFIETLRLKIPELQYDFAKDQNGHYVFKMVF